MAEGLDLSMFAEIIRPARVLTLAEAADDVARHPTYDPLLLYGGGQEALAALPVVVHRVGFGSALVLLPGTDMDLARELAEQGEFVEWYKGGEYPGIPPGAMTWVKQRVGGPEGYSSHTEVLLEAVRRTVGPVLELGSGKGSTPLLHIACITTGRILVTVDNSEEWIANFTHLATPDHVFEYAEDPAATAWLTRPGSRAVRLCEPIERWGVVFVDHAPGETRKDAIELARHISDLVVCHDTEERSYGMDAPLGRFKYRHDHRTRRPWTTVASDVMDVWK